MISQCFNPDCKQELRYLRSGRVVRILKTTPEGVEVEHFWLCGTCYAAHDFSFDEDGNPALTNKSALQIASDAESWLDHTLVA